MFVVNGCPACGGSAVVSETNPPIVGCNQCGHVAHVERTIARCQVCGDEFTEGPTSRDRERFARAVCGGCDETTMFQRITSISMTDMDDSHELGEAGA